MAKMSLNFDVDGIICQIENAIQEQLNELDEDTCLFTPLTPSARKLFEEICCTDNPTELLQQKINEAEQASNAKEREIRGIIGELNDKKCISVQWGDDTVSICWF